MQIFRVYVCKNQIFIAAHIQTGAFLITHHSPVVGCVTLNTNPQYFHLDIFNVLMLIFCRWCVRRYERFFLEMIIRSVNVMTGASGADACFISLS